MKDRPGCMNLLELAIGISWVGVGASLLLLLYGCGIKSNQELAIGCGIGGAIQFVFLAAFFHSLRWIVWKMDCPQIAEPLPDSDPEDEEPDGIRHKPVLKRRKFPS